MFFGDVVASICFINQEFLCFDLYVYLFQWLLILDSDINNFYVMDY